MELLLQSTTMAASTGLGCGTCCSPGISLFLSGYTMTHAKNSKQTILSFLYFYLGKILAVIFVCVISATIGAQLIDENGLIGGLNIHFIVNLLLSLGAILMLIRLYLEKKGFLHRCKNCHSRQSTSFEFQNRHYLPLFGMGILYGISPCGPLIIMAGYAATLSIWHAFLTGGIFALASSISPMILLFFLSGALSGPVQKELARYLELLKVLCYVLLLVFSLVAMIQ